MARDTLHSSRNEFAYLALRHSLLNGTFALGERLRLPDLCSEYGVSLTVLREGLVRLTAQGLIKFEANKGYWVPSYTADDITDLVFVRTSVECLTLRVSIERGGVDWSTEVVAAQHRLALTPRVSMIDHPEENEQWYHVHRLFHEALASASGSPRLEAYRRQLFDEAELMRQLSVTLSGIKRDVQEEHAAIADAAMRRDADAACELMVRHLEITASNALSALARDDGVLLGRSVDAKAGAPERPRRKRAACG
jgi:DNA-binding GntR family transcriptional regulator